MARFHERQRVWRIGAVLVFGAALLGPWVFDKINVPAAYPCGSPNIRLEGDFCGVPLSGLAIAAMAFGVLNGLAQGAATEATSRPDVSTALLFLGLAVLVFGAPLFGLARPVRDRRRWQLAQTIAWGLALAVVVATGIRTYELPPWEAWGAWLYTALAAGAAVLGVSELTRREPARPT